MKKNTLRRCLKHIDHVVLKMYILYLEISGFMSSYPFLFIWSIDGNPFTTIIRIEERGHDTSIFILVHISTIIRLKLYLKFDFIFV